MRAKELLDWVQKRRGSPMAATPAPMAAAEILANPEREAHSIAHRSTFPQVVNGWVGIIGRKLTAYIAP